MAQITLNSSGVASSGSLLLQTNGTTTQATFDTSGNLGLGVTPSTWNGNGKNIEVGSAGNIVNGSSNELLIVKNGYYNSGWKYGVTNPASSYSQYNGTHIWNIAPSGTAGNAITFTQAMTLDASGNLGIGTTSPSYKLDVNGSIRGDTFVRSTSGTVSSYLVANNGGGFGVVGTASNHPILFNTNDTERARIDTSGNLLVGTTDAGINDKGVVINSAAYLGDNYGRINIKKTFSGNVVGINFSYNNGTVGNITYSNTATAYNTSSDYRLKHDVQPMTGALAKVAALKPVTYKWNADNSNGEGFIAHELAEVVPDCVHGEKDAVDENGNPVYQGIDTSFLVATLTAAIQEQQAIIEQLTNRITALEQA